MSPTVRRLLVAVFVAAVLFFLARHTSLFPTFKNPFREKAILVDQTPLLVNEIRDIAQLMTVEAYNEVVVDSTKYPFGISPRIFNAIPGHPLTLLGGSQLVLIVKGKVIAGVDLKTLDSNNVQIKGDSLFVQLPSAHVLDVITNPSDVETFIETGTWTEVASVALQNKARNQLVQQALAQGALQQADAKARSLVYELLKNMDYKAVFVTTAVQVNAPLGK
jgi:Protein of unknown function (DUF4230)